MAIQLKPLYVSHHNQICLYSPLTSTSLGFSFPSKRIKHGSHTIVASSSTTLWDNWKPQKEGPSSSAPSLSDIIWPSAGGFVAMAVLGKMDQILAPKGISMTIAPFGAVCAVLFSSPSSPAARKYNMFMAQIGCAAIGVVALIIFGPGWLARSVGLAASIAFMIYTRSTHPPAASLPILFIDGVKFHHLSLWFTLFPGAAGCIIICIIEEMSHVNYSKKTNDLMNGLTNIKYLVMDRICAGNTLARTQVGLFLHHLSVGYEYV